MSKMLKFYENPLGYNRIDQDDIYYYKQLDDGWQMADDNSYEYRDAVFYTYNQQKLLELIYENYADPTIKEMDKVEKKIKYFFRMRKKY